jgi:hypothetical protein
MSTTMPPGLDANLSATNARRDRVDLFAVGLWICAALVAVFFSAIMSDSAAVDGIYLPRTNDSLYHARRILDAIVGPGFYQFDPRLHVPDGAWISWPWAYDYLMAKAAQVAIWIDPSLDPLAFISYVPVAWVVINTALFLVIAGAISLSREMRVLVMLCFAFSPLTQLLHSVAMIDHHYIEHTFVLLNVWLGIRWFQKPAATGRALALGATLGVAQAFHNGLFILQLIPLAALFVLWLRGESMPAVAVRAFAVALLVATQLILVPSEPYRLGMFEYGLLSWFHFYVAICTGAAANFLAWQPLSRRNFILLCGLCLALAAPLAAQALSGAAWITGNFSILDQITEMQSP